MLNWTMILPDSIWPIWNSIIISINILLLTFFFFFNRKASLQLPKKFKKYRCILVRNCSKNILRNMLKKNQKDTLMTLEDINGIYIFILNICNCKKNLWFYAVFYFSVTYRGSLKVSKRC